MRYAILAALLNDKEVKPADVVHISCHGHNDPWPLLCLESEAGDAEITSPEKFMEIFSQNIPSLLFLSACKTSQPPESKKKAPSHQTFSQRLIRRAFPAVLGWSGSVGDSDATRFAAAFYRELSLSSTLEKATAIARSRLLNPDLDSGADKSRDWHLARLYLGPQGGGVIAENKKRRPFKGHNAGVKEFLDRNKRAVPVAKRSEFVGRRRETQKILKELRDEEGKSGVLIHAIGNQGKSSLAARVANRIFTHETVVIYGGKEEKFRYSAQSIFNELAERVTKPEQCRITDMYKKNIERNFYPALKEILENIFSGFDEQGGPILLIIDDLEKILEDPDNENSPHKINPDYHETMSSVVRAFERAKTMSRLIITSRHKFSLEHSDGSDLAELLMDVPLPSMNRTESRKQYSAKYGALEKEVYHIKLDESRVLEACQGNPGLQDIMFGLFYESPPTFLKSLGDIENYLKSGKKPETQKVRNFLEGLAIRKLTGLLGTGEEDILRVAALFEIPVPMEVFQLTGELSEVPETDKQLKRLVGLGVLESFEDFVDHQKTALFLNNIVRPQIKRLNEKDENFFSAELCKRLFETWGGAGTSRPWPCDLELLKLGLASGNSEVVSACATNCLYGMHKNLLTQKAAEYAVPAVSLLESSGENVTNALYREASIVCHEVGEIRKSEEYIEKAIKKAEETNKNSYETAVLLANWGRFLGEKSKPDKALKKLEKAKKLFDKLEYPQQKAAIMVELAKIKEFKGEFDEALELIQESVQVFDKFVDMRQKAVAMTQLARTKVKKGERDEALKVFQESAQVFDKLGYPQQKAAVLGDIADIKAFKGELDEALNLLQEVIDISDKIDDTIGMASAMHDIAEIKVKKKEIDEALKIYHEIIPVFESFNKFEFKAMALV